MVSGASKRPDALLKDGDKALSRGVFKWSQDFQLAAEKYQQAAQLLKAAEQDEQASAAYIKYAKALEACNQNLLAADGFAEAAKLLPDYDWQKSMSFLRSADLLYKMSGFEDRGVIQMKKLAQNLGDELIEAQLTIYREIFPKLFESQEMMTFNHDLIEGYQYQLAKHARWLDYIKMKRVLIAYYCGVGGPPDHRARRSFLEIVCCQIMMGDHAFLDQSLLQFRQQVCGDAQDNPFDHEEYEAAALIQEYFEKQDFEGLKDLFIKKAVFMFIELQIFKAFKAWVQNPPTSSCEKQFSKTKEAIQEELDFILC